MIDHQCIHVVALCESLLIQAKIEAGLFTPRLEKTDISVIARDVVTAMRPICAQREQRISLDTPQVTRRIPADPTLIAQALTNLVSNASRFTSVGGNLHIRVMAIDTGICVYVIRRRRRHESRATTTAVPAVRDRATAGRRYRPGSGDHQDHRGNAQRVHHGRYDIHPRHDVPVHAALGRVRP